MDLPGDPTSAAGTNAVRRALSALPSGTLVTAIGVGVLGVGSYVHLAIAGHNLSTAEMADLSVLWSVVFSLGYGLFLPAEQELTRVCAARRTAGAGTRPLWRRGIGLVALIAGALAATVAATSPALARELFVGDGTLVFVTLGGLLGLAAGSPVRGQAAGMARFDLYAGQLGLDGALRIVLAVALPIAGARSATAFGLVLVVAPLVATAVLLRPVARTAQPGPPTDSRELGRGVWPLMISVLLGQFMLNSVIVSARILAPEQIAVVAALLAALVVIRVPALIFGAMQASLLSGLAGSVSAGDRAAYGRLLRHGVAVVTAMMVCFAIPLVAIGPWLVRTLFAAADVLSRVDFALLTAGTWAYLLALVLGQGAMSVHRHRVQMLAWIAGALLLLMITLWPGPVLARLEWAYLAGNATVAAILAAFLLWQARLDWRGHDHP